METSKELVAYNIIFLDEDGTTVLKDLQTLTEGEIIIPPQDPIKFSDEDWEYVFDGWYDQSKEKLTKNKTISRTLIYQARYVKVEHEYDHKNSIIQKANCIQDGYEELTCSKCQQVTRIIIPKREHSWKEEIKKEPECVEVGYKKRSCQNRENSYYETCGMIEDNIIIPALGHNCKISNIVRSESALRRGATFVCVHKGCNYSYTLCFQGDENNDEIGEMPSIVKGDEDRWVGTGILHIGADISAASGYAKENIVDKKKGLYLSSKGGG